MFSLRSSQVESLVGDSPVERLVGNDRVEALVTRDAVVPAYAYYRSAQDGVWSDYDTWEVNDGDGVNWYPANSYPGQHGNTQDVSITHNVTMDVSPANAMHDVTIDGAIDDGGYTLRISGDISCSGTLTMSGELVLSGSEDQSIDFGAQTINDLTVNKSAGTATLTTDTTMDGDLSVEAGTLVNNDIVFTINGVSVISGGVFDSNTTSNDYYNVFGGGLTLSGGTFNAGAGANIFGADFTKSGGTLNAETAIFDMPDTITMTLNADQTFDRLSYGSSLLSGARTLTIIGSGGTRTVTIATSVERYARSQGLILSSAVLAYAAGATLYYSPSGVAMTADADEWPVSGGPDNVKFTGSHNLTVPFARTTVSFECDGTTSKTITLSGTLTTTNLYRRGTVGGTISGTIVYTSESTLMYYAGDTIIGDEWPATNGPESCVVNLTTSSNRCESSPAAPGITRTLTKNFTGAEGILDMGGNDANGILYVEGVVDQQSGFSLEDTEINPVSFDFLNCLAFAGDNDYCLRTATGETTFDSKTQLSIGMWIFIPTGTAANKILWWYGNNSNRDLIVYNEAKSGSLHQIALYCHPNNSTYRTAKTGYVVTENAWHFVVFTYDGAGATDADKVKCKIDDASQSLTFAGGGFPTALPVFSTGGTTRMIFGAGWGLSTQLWAGRIDHAAFYFGVWDDTTKTALYNSGNGADYSLYDLLYKFDGTGTSTTLDDEGALNGDMTLTNFSFDGSTSGWRTHV